MTILAWLLLLGLAWGLWNLFQKLQRLDALIAQWQDTLATVKGLDEGAVLPEAHDAVPASPLRVIIEVTDALELAKRYHWAGGAGAMAPAVLKKVMQDKIYEQIHKSIQEGGHEADVKVIVL